MRSSYCNENLDWLKDPKTVILHQDEWFDGYNILDSIKRSHEIHSQVDRICKNKWTSLGNTFCFSDPKDAMIVKLSVK